MPNSMSNFMIKSRFVIDLVLAGALFTSVNRQASTFSTLWKDFYQRSRRISLLSQARFQTYRIEARTLKID